MHKNFRKIELINVLKSCGVQIKNMRSKKAEKDKQKPETKPQESQPVTLREKGTILIKILAKPNSKLNSITDISPDGVGVQINAPPVDGDANAALIKYLSSVLNVKKSEITLEKGARSKSKTVIVSNVELTVESVLDKLKMAQTNT